MRIKNLILAGAVSAAMMLPVVAAEIEIARDAGAVIQSMRPEARAAVLADDTENAIAFGNAHQDELWRTTYRRETDNLYSAARTLARSVKSAATAA